MSMKKKEALLVKLLKDIREKGLNNGISDDTMRRDLFRRLYEDKVGDEDDTRSPSSSLSSPHPVIIFLILPLSALLLSWFTNANFSVYEMWEDVLYSPCLIEVEGNTVVQEITRPVVNCSMCEGITAVPTVTNITHEEFVMKYAYSGCPVLVKGAMRDWAALETFSFTFFRDLYMKTEGALDSVENECQFFSYKTEFVNLREVFEMPEERAAFKENQTPWYIGWSNCHPTISKELRKHYHRPYFLPKQTESSILDWMFMGGFGPGAMIHIDYVQRPSWQAQVSGTKRWTLIPPPECEHVCTSMEVKVEKGDIVCINTNEWYHDTYIEPGEISITIGSEYD